MTAVYTEHSERIQAEPAQLEEPQRLQTLEEFQREIAELTDQGLRGRDFVRALSGGPGLLVRTPEDLDAFLRAECEPSI